MEQIFDCVSYENFVVKCPPYSSIEVLFWISAVKTVKTQVQVKNHREYIRFPSTSSAAAAGLLTNPTRSSFILYPNQISFESIYLTLDF